jgi:hypothetical protein
METIDMKKIVLSLLLGLVCISGLTACAPPAADAPADEAPAGTTDS